MEESKITFNKVCLSSSLKTKNKKKKKEVLKTKSIISSTAALHNGQLTCTYKKSKLRVWIEKKSRIMFWIQIIASSVLLWCQGQIRCCEEGKCQNKTLKNEPAEIPCCDNKHLFFFCCCFRFLKKGNWNKNTVPFQFPWLMMFSEKTRKCKKIVC